VDYDRYANSIYIGGKWRAAQSGRTFAVTNPATGETISTIADGGTDDVRMAIDTAHGAQAAWSTGTAYERSDVLYRAHGLLL
jgi:succinate-semialdehyde dehydrogenase/glutarate-semialdehyde dehydrogenase